MKETSEVELHTPSHALVISCFVLNVFHLPNTKAYYYFIYYANLSFISTPFSTSWFLKAIHHILVLSPRNFSELVFSCLPLEREFLKYLCLSLSLSHTFS